MGMRVRLRPMARLPLSASLPRVQSVTTWWGKVKRWMCENQFSDLLTLTSAGDFAPKTHQITKIRCLLPQHLDQITGFKNRTEAKDSLLYEKRYIRRVQIPKTHIVPILCSCCPPPRPPQALGDTFCNAVIQKSCYHASGNEMQWELLQSYFLECSRYTLFV